MCAKEWFTEVSQESSHSVVDRDGLNPSVLGLSSSRKTILSLVGLEVTRVV